MGSLMYQVLGASVLDGGTFEGIEADRQATVPAVIVVLASSLAGAFAATSGLEPRLPVIAIFMTVAVIIWLALVQLILLIGGHQFRRPETRVDFGELVRTTGFAAAPGTLQIFAVVPAVATPVFIVTWIWMWAAMVVAVKHALDIRSTWRAIAICGAALGVVLAVLVLLTRGLEGLLI
jgi:Yip1 domain